MDKSNVLECSRLWREVVTRIGEGLSRGEALAHSMSTRRPCCSSRRPTSSMSCSPRTCLATSCPTRPEASWDRWACSARPALAARSDSTNRCTDRRRTLQARASRIRWERFFRWRCCCGIRFHLEKEAACIENAVSAVLSQGARTADLAGKSHAAISTAEMGRRVVEAVKGKDSASITAAVRRGLALPCILSGQRIPADPQHLRRTCGRRRSED